MPKVKELLTYGENGNKKHPLIATTMDLGNLYLTEKSRIFIPQPRQAPERWWQL